jgi:crossover junction endodeoxyribonuclease RusA
VLTVNLPFPPAALNPNNKSGRHWGETNAAKARYRNDCWALTLQAARGFVPPDGDMPLRLTFVQPPRRRTSDADNLLASVKAGLDGFAAALKVDDSRFEPLTICRKHGDAPGALIVEVAP